MDKVSQKRGGFYWFGTPPKPYISVTKIKDDTLRKRELEYWFAKETYLAMVKDPSLSMEVAMSAPRDAGRKAASRGTTIHSIIEAWKEGGQVVNMPIPELRPYVDAFAKWTTDFKVEILDQEKEVVSERWGYAGRLDMLAKVDGKIILVDVKTNKDATVYRDTSLQTSAYMEALKENKIAVECAYTLALGGDGRYTFSMAEDCFEVFIALKKVWIWQNKELCKKVGYK